jgi:hypothetical protein
MLFKKMFKTNIISDALKGRKIVYMCATLISRNYAFKVLAN